MAYVLAALGVLFVVYGFIAYSAAAGTWFFVIWFALGALALSGAWAAHSGQWDSLPLFGRRAIEVVVGSVLVCFIATQALIMRDFNDTGEDGVDYLIVLGSKMSGEGMSDTLRNRLDATCDYLTRNPKTRCIVSGGKLPDEPFSEADVMFDYLSGHGISPDRIIREDQSRNTVENISYCKDLVEDPCARSVEVVTSDYHLFRSLSIARKAGFTHVCGLAAASPRRSLPNSLVRESLAIIKDFATGHL